MNKKQKVLNTVLFQTVSRSPEFRGKITVNSSAIFFNDKLVCSLDSFLKLQRREEFINLLHQIKIKEINMKQTTKLKLENIIRRLIKEETSNSVKILTLVKQLKKIDSQKRDPLNDPDTPEGERIIAQLQSLGVMNADGHFIHGHPLMDKIDAIWG